MYRSQSTQLLLPSVPSLGANLPHVLAIVDTVEGKSRSNPMIKSVGVIIVSVQGFVFGAHL